MSNASDTTCHPTLPTDLLRPHARAAQDRTMNSKTSKDVEGLLPGVPSGKPTVGVVTNVYERTPLQARLTELLNDYEDCSGDEHQRSGIARQIRETMQEFRRAKGDGHTNPAWVLTAMEGAIEFTIGDTARALALDREALHLASASWQRAQSLANISDSLRVLQRPQEAVDPALEAVRIDPGNHFFWGYLLLALYQSGSDESARLIVKRLLEVSDLRSDSSGWRAFFLGNDECRAIDPTRIPEILQVWIQLH